MTRTIFAIGTALLAATTFFASAAEACISCNYVPEVLHTPVKGSAAKRAPKRTYVANKEQAARPAKKRIAKAAPAHKKAIVAKAAPVKKQTVAKAEPTKKVTVAKAEPAKKDTLAKAEPVTKTEPVAETATAAPAETQSEERSAPVSVASVLESQGQGVSAEEPEAEEANVGCKKFFPAVGMTLTVPCE